MLRLAPRLFSALRLRTSQAARLLAAPIHGCAVASSQASVAQKRRRRILLGLEHLETRELLSASTTTHADASVVTPAPGQEVTLLAVVAPSGSGTPTGTVTFQEGSTTLGIATLNGGIARLAVANGLALGSNSIQANYSGDGNFTASTGNLTLTVAAPANDVVTNQLDSVPQAAADQNAPLPDNTDQLVRYADGVVTVSQLD